MKIVIKNKIQKVIDLTEKINKSQIVIFFEYAGLPVSAFMELRSALRKVDTYVKVYPNNIMKRATISANYAELASDLNGNKAIVYSFSNLIDSAKIIYEFSQKNPLIKVVNGIIEQKVSSLQDVCELALLPSRQMLLTMLSVGILMPVVHLSLSLKMILEKINYKNDNKKDNKKMSKLTKENFINSLKEMSLLEIKELVDALNETFGIDPKTLMTSDSSNKQTKDQIAEQTEFKVIMKEIGNNKIAVIRKALEITGLPLSEAKSLVETPDAVIKEKITKEQAEDIKSQLESTGAVIEIK